MLQKIIEYLNTIKRHPGRIFIKFERDKGSFEISFCVHSVRIFTKFSGDSYYEPVAWFMIYELLVFLNPNFHLPRSWPP